MAAEALKATDAGGARLPYCTDVNICCCCWRAFYCCVCVSCSGSWRNEEFKEYNFNAMGQPIVGGNLHPLMKVRQHYSLNTSNMHTWR